LVYLSNKWKISSGSIVGDWWKSKLPLIKKGILENGK
jgi:hypothetical protein